MSMPPLQAILLRRLEDPDTAAMIRRALERSIVLDTWMAGQHAAHLTPAARDLLEREATAAALAAVGRVFPSRPMPPQYVDTVFHELLVSSALFSAHDRTGLLQADAQDVADAARRLREFTAREAEGPVAPAMLYVLITAYENLKALDYYGSIPLDEFLRGTRHRPWLGYLLQDDLDLLLEVGLAERRGTDLAPTAAGRMVLPRLRRLLVTSGELSFRLRGQHLSLFTRLTDYDQLFRAVAPTMLEDTRRFLRFAGVVPGMRVLEVGCGTGRVTIDAGLLDLVGPDGVVTATDPAPGLLNVAREKAQRRETANLRLVRSPAEALPFPDAAFDLALGVFFLHFTDPSRALREMLRVVRPGGAVAVFVWPRIDGASFPILPRWFGAAARLAQEQGLPFEFLGSEPDETGHLLRELGCRVAQQEERLPFQAPNAQIGVRWVLQGPGLFQSILEPLPHAARRQLMDDLVERGRRICAETSLEERTIWGRCEFVRGEKP